MALAAALPALAAPAGWVLAAGAAPMVPAVTIGVGAAHSPAQVATSVQILLVLTVLSLAPAVLLLMTSFTRIVIVLSFARSALGTGQIPPNQILVGLALFLTLFVMSPTIQQIYRSAWQPYQAGQIALPAALRRAETPLRAFMLRQTRTADLRLFEDMQRHLAAQGASATRVAGSAASPGAPVPAVPAAVPAVPAPGAATGTGSAAAAATGTAGATAPVGLTVLVPAFVVSELRTAFEMGFVLFIPFVIIDLVVGSTLMAMGMIMLPPMLVSLPFKVLLFVLVDGWTLLVQSLVLSFH